MSTLTFLAFVRGALRDRTTLFWSLAFPLVMATVLGFVFDSADAREGLLGGVAFVSAVFFSTSGTAFTVLGQRNRGVYKLVRLTPTTTLRFVGTLALARGVVSVGCAAFVLLVCAAILRVPLEVPGVLLTLPALAAVVVAFTFLGFIIGNLANNEAQAAAINNLVTLPVLLMTSTFLPIGRGPAWVQTLVQALPFEHALAMVRGALAGAAGTALREATWLLALGLLGLAAAVWTFRWDPYAARLVKD